MSSIISVTPTICTLMGISSPCLSVQDVLDPVIQTAKVELGIITVDKWLVYSPDAIGAYLYRDYQSSFEPVLRHAPIIVRLCSVVPPVTPVCYASMFTGAPPEVHGIQKYEKPVLTCDTIFDALIRAGKRVAIVAVADASIDRIFRNRNMDYFSEIYDEQVTNRTIELLESNEYDFILAYHQEYDDTLHRTTPQSKEALQALGNHIKSFDKIACAFEEHWREHNRVILFGPDHGAHIDLETGKGSHDKNIAENLHILHFFGVYPRR